MTNHLKKKTIMVVTILTVVGFGAYAFAGWGMDYDRSGWGHRGPGWHHGGCYGPGDGGKKGNLSNEEIEAMDKERASFFEATKDLRRNVYSKDLEMRSELAKENPNIDKAKKLQKEISELEAKIEQERIDHRIKVRKINPDAGRGYGPRWGRGSGRGGNCWR